MESYGPTPPDCECCGWSGEWAEVHVDIPDNSNVGHYIGPDPERNHTDPPYYCPVCHDNLDG